MQREHKVALTIKRIVDCIAAILLLVFLSPAFVIISFLIKQVSSGPIFFRQDRLGLNGQVFSVFKFRTMVKNASKFGDGFVISENDERITPLGKTLRKYRLDELPQLINVVKGEMSLVGPRPLLPEYLEYYTKTDRKRLLMSPGMTGWQQVNGGSCNTWEERIALDIWYIENWSLWLDIRILFLTVRVVLKADTVYGKDGYQFSGLPTAVRESFIKSEDQVLSNKETK